MAVRTYNPSVRVGNWNEDVQLEEDTLKDFLYRKERGELHIQNKADLQAEWLAEIQTSISRDGKLHFGDKVMIWNPPQDDSRPTYSLSASPTSSGGGACASLSTNTESVIRNTFVIKSCDGTAEGMPVMYGQPFYIQDIKEGFYLWSDRASLHSSYAKKSRHNLVAFNEEPSHLTKWMIKAFNPQFRMELDLSPVPANQKIILTHVKTNSNLCNEGKMFRTRFGKECEVSVNTMLDSHKAEQDTNHWAMRLLVPGDGSIAPGLLP